jgi:hypothetical protein
MFGSRFAPRRAGALALVAVILAGCSSASATWPAIDSGGGIRLATSNPSSETARPEETGAGPIVTAGTVTVDKITVDYIYRSDLITPLAHLYGTFLDDFMIAEIANGNDTSVKVVVTSEITGFTTVASKTVTIAPGATEEIRENPALTTAAIDELSSGRPGELHVRVTYLDNGVERVVLDETNETSLWARRDFPWSIKGMTQQEDFDLLGVMVTPNDLKVEALVRAAAYYDPNKAMTGGYSSERDAEGDVYQRLSNIWQAEANDYNLTYISTTVTFAPGDTQRIRLPSEVLDQSSGNCIELALLYAAAVEALNMQPVIVIVPGHAYVAVRTDNVNDYYYFIETTMIGGASFDQAVERGGQEFDEAQPHLADNDSQYGWVSIAEGRQNGVLPIPWH